MNWNRIIYKMTSRTNGKYYIGKCFIRQEYKENPLYQVIDFYYNKQLKVLNGEKSTEFQYEIFKIGLENFEFIILEYCNYGEEYEEEAIFKKYLSNETNTDLLLYYKQREYVEKLKQQNMKEYDKLVRDKIPQIIEKSGCKCEVEIVDNEIALEYLYKKLLEETNELIQDRNLEEVADVIEVVFTIANRCVYTLEDIFEELDKKTREKGSFEGNIILKKVYKNNK